MKEILKELGKFLLEAVKQVDYKSLLYKVCKGTILPLIAKKVQDSTSKIDDKIFAGLEQLVEKFLAPDLSPKTLDSLQVNKSVLKEAPVVS